jgi:hypothetical protein
MTAWTQASATSRVSDLGSSQVSVAKAAAAKAAIGTRSSTATAPSSGSRTQCCRGGRPLTRRPGSAQREPRQQQGCIAETDRQRQVAEHLEPQRPPRGLAQLIGQPAADFRQILDRGGGDDQVVGDGGDTVADLLQGLGGGLGGLGLIRRVGLACLDEQTEVLDQGRAGGRVLELRDQRLDLLHGILGLLRSGRRLCRHQLRPGTGSLEQAGQQHETEDSKATQRRPGAERRHGTMKYCG